jgi:hypothetical protein
VAEEKRLQVSGPVSKENKKVLPQTIKRIGRESRGVGKGEQGEVAGDTEMIKVCYKQY